MEREITTTYTQLINDPVFLDKRIREQKVYIRSVIDRAWRREISVERYTELLDSAYPVLHRLKAQLELINESSRGE